VKSFATTVARPFDEVERRVRAALREQGFGVLTEIDIAATLHDKLGVDRPPLKILGACNPHFAQRALEIDPSVSLVLPCNVALETTGDGATRVAVWFEAAGEGRARVSMAHQRLPDADTADRGVHAALINIVKAGLIRQLPNGNFAPATVLDTIRLRRAM